MSREAMQMALDALENIGDEWGFTSKRTLPKRFEAITALRQALETEQEPVAWITNGGKGELWWYRSSKFDEEGNVIGPNPDDIPLYAAPPKKQWVGLTEEEIEHIADSEWEEAFVRMIEAKLREKNT